MPSPSRTNRFQSFTPLRSTTGSLRRLRTAFSPSRTSARSTSPTSVLTTSTITSPLTRNSSPHSYRSSSSSSSSDQASNVSSPSSSSIRHLLALRRKPSVLEFEMQHERRVCGVGQLDVLEPRPGMGESEVLVVGIFEVLDGKC